MQINLITVIWQAYGFYFHLSLLSTSLMRVGFYHIQDQNIDPFKLIWQNVKQSLNLTFDKKPLADLYTQIYHSSSNYEQMISH